MREVGLLLKEGRIALGFEISDIAKKTCICQHYLRAMEEGRFDIIPTVFDKGYIKMYAKAVEIDAKPVLALYEQQKSKKAVHPAIQSA